MVTEKAILAGGCFWGMQDLIRKPTASSPRASATPVATRPTRRIATTARMRRRSRSSSTRSGSPIATCSSSSSRSTTPRRRTARATTSARATARRSSTSTTSRRASPRTPSPTSTPPASGPATSSRKSCRPVRSGRPSPNTRTTSSDTPTATRATSSGPGGDCRSGPRLQPARQDERRGSPSSRLIVTDWVRSSSECATDNCGRISVTSQPSTMPSPPFNPTERTSGQTIIRIRPSGIVDA